MTTRVYVGNLPLDIRERELEDIFAKVGGCGCCVAACGLARAARMGCAWGPCSRRGPTPFLTPCPPCPRGSSQYGRIRSIDIKTPGRPPAFAFIEFGEWPPAGS